MEHLRTILCAVFFFGLGQVQADVFPDGTPVDPWFECRDKVDPAGLGERFVVTDYGVVRDSTLVQTAVLQAVIDRAAAQGGVVVIPEGVFLSGALFFRPGTHLHVEKGGVLKGSDDISDFPIVDTRIEGQSLRYFAALVNAEGVDGFTISGEGIIDGNGERYWRSFWLRREVNPDCTNMDELRPRLVYISRSKRVRLQDVTLRNSPFWTTHLYRCDFVRLLDLRILAPAEPVRAPSSDAVDLDACTHVHICGCYMSVNDDAVALKGGKGPWADSDPTNGGNRNILIEDCTYGFCHSCLTCGSEAIHCRNIVLRRCRVDRADRLLWLKMRPDTPQLYEHILVEEISGNARSFLFVKPWTQFFDLKGREDIPMSQALHITMQHIDLDCDTFFDAVQADDQYRLSDFVFRDLRIRARDRSCRRDFIPRFVWSEVELRQL
ncbi:MAG: glycosyl hydrolase family 28 protein [Alistipes sp.]|nr:glycosyl hydrolase family 28 protein [Alistipes senegalensis]MCM1250357.1 glycosyl hydrolase family 28 protein [Alistipes sp.]